ncbi:glycosyltransferase family 4 protein [Flavobacterium marginilacus]|uniref:glycosyltransferase family 4 protein n=1 Tax=Flavobacterium marginilacus TaxID=3003256 RepID=UPI00248D7371|nr:glycosyltransferase family 4 protein [Flavobacterium marginilacus]
MRIIQLIDSLDAGGAERMAVSYANALADIIEFSGLVTTRKEGALLHQIHPKVSYLFLKKSKKIDIESLLRLRSFVLKNKITHIHAHSTSFFLAFLLKSILPSVKLIWHYHYGNNQTLSKNRVLIFRIVMPFFSGVIAVNQNLKYWIENNLKSKTVIYLPNFPIKDNTVVKNTIIKGIKGKQIVSLANLREDKNHFLLLEVAQKLKESHSEWTFHLIGKDFDDNYSKQIKSLILDFNLSKNVFLYGSKQDVENILNQASIAILTSQSEGLPVALLEYGLYKKAVVVTSVGEIPSIVKARQNGFIVDADRPDLFYKYLVALIENDNMRKDFGETLFNTIQANYTAESVMKKYINWLQAH